MQFRDEGELKWKHIRTIFLTFLTVVLAVTVSACRKSEDSAAETSTEHAAEDVMNLQQSFMMQKV